MTQAFGVGKFQPQIVAPAASRGPAPAPAPVGQSRWAGLQPARVQEPMLGVGDYIVRVRSNELSMNPQSREESFKGHIEVVWAAEGSATRVGDPAIVVCKLVGAAAQRNAERMMAYIMFSAGYDDVREYDQFDPQRRFISAVQGEANEYSAAGLTINGRLVRVQVLRGNDVMTKATPAAPSAPTGDFYREYSWSVVPEEQQDAVKKVGA